MLNLPRLPLLDNLKGYQGSWLRSDISAGVAIAAVGLPSAIAYPAIAGLPPETGLYASITPLVAYALFGPSRQLIVGPDAATMTVLAAVLTTVFASSAGGADRVTAAALLALIVGILCLIARLVRLGVLATFLSRPILTGFFAGISLSILVGQIKRVTGVQIESDGLISPILELLRQAGSIHWPTLVFALACFALLQVARFYRSPVPGPVIVVFVAVLLSYLFDFEGRGMTVVGNIPDGLPTFVLPRLEGLPIDGLLTGGAAIFLVSFGSGVIAARSFAALGGYRVDPNRELSGFGAANIAAGLFGTFPVTASDSRTAVNFAVGGRSQIASLVAAGTLMVVLLFLGDVLRILPVAALGAILAATALSLIDIDGLRRIWTVNRIEFIFALIALWGPIGLGVLNGVVIAIAATLVYLILQTMYPHDAMLGRIPGRDGFYKLHRMTEARPVPGFGACMVQDSLLFYNADYVRERLEVIAESLPQPARWLVIDASAIPQIDSTAADMLGELQSDLKNRGVTLGLAELHTDARALLERSGVVEKIGPGMIFEGMEDALDAYETKYGRNDGQPTGSVEIKPDDHVRTGGKNGQA
ncbi:SulP family inorganic anion transporter [Ensifer sp. ENS07]|uniref:SulP family inorganic anion transporter n=3 Tax=Ensifer TaxID=106591 RepID=A0A9Q9DCZ7_ENSAD|nr:MULTISPECIES: SulP family inorganic anion transporter [Ensifer]OWZ89281.1 sulfate transporter [Sinorhizobium sp. LM21]MBD9498631.1 SulP family inorganic anion transporter [Ensifer sp. ENS01]MBD9561261.1 SulP family inorganic anion transporter [Ensifer sp. ENS03]MBD9641805.1 SulP family inorganic anion transporter [Ensifer sp. ENS07]USJ26771.1 SulP family inorganic anion transporter [Ensifer adhaerens]